MFSITVAAAFSSVVASGNFKIGLCSLLICTDDQVTVQDWRSRSLISGCGSDVGSCPSYLRSNTIGQAILAMKGWVYCRDGQSVFLLRKRRNKPTKEKEEESRCCNIFTSFTLESPTCFITDIALQRASCLEAEYMLNTHTNTHSQRWGERSSHVLIVTMTHDLPEASCCCIWPGGTCVKEDALCARNELGFLF